MSALVADGAPRPQRLLVVVAHPDDETFGCGSLLLHAAAAGMQSAVLCATRGEAGEAPDTVTGDLGVVREAETRAAAEVLGVGRVDFLDLADSGMSGEAGPHTLAGAPTEQVAARVRAVVEEWAPTVVVTLDASDGHRDHAAIRDATLLAVDTTTSPVERVFLHCLPQELMGRWIAHMATHDPSWEHLRSNPPGTPPEQITTRLDTAVHLEDRERAMGLHASQRSPYEGLPADLRHAFLTTEHLRLVRPV